MTAYLLNGAGAAPATVTPLSTPRPTVIHDHSDAVFYVVVIAIIALVLFSGWWLISKGYYEHNWGGCAEVSLCTEFARADRADARIDRTRLHTEAMAKIDADERLAAAQREQDAALATAAAERQPIIFRPEVAEPRIVGGAERSVRTGGVATLDGPPGRCVLHGPGHQGEHGFLWRDGRCHESPPEVGFMAVSD